MAMDVPCMFVRTSLCEADLMWAACIPDVLFYTTKRVGAPPPGL
jgi:hypothetical protein